jgi:hypothetical protein
MADDFDLPDEVRRAAALYVKRGESIGGPFARGLLERHLELGRLAGSDLLGVDRTHWWPADSILALEESLPAEAAMSPGAATDLDWTEERRRARRRWIDERSGTDRRALADSAGSNEARSGKDRRALDSGPELPPRFGAPDEAGATGTRRSLVIVTAVLVVLVGIGVYAWFFAPRFAPRIHLLP